MKKMMWEVELKQGYDTELHSRRYCVMAKNAKEAINKALNAHKRKAKKNFDYLNYNCATNVEMIAVTD